MGSEKFLWENYNSFFLNNDLSRLRKILVRYELFKKTLNVPGDIVECGVFKGVGMLQWCKLIEIFLSGSNKKVIGFDTFSGFSKNLQPFEEKNADDYVEEANYKEFNLNILTKKITDQNLLNRMEFVKGELEDTAIKYINENQGLKISLLNLDLDTYGGTTSALNAFYPLITKNGVIIIDEYGCRGWGESKAVDEFFIDKNVNIISPENSNSPTAYIIKNNF